MKKMTDQPHSPERLIDLASQPAGGPEETRLGAGQQAEVDEQRAVRRALSSLPAPQLTPEERRDLRRAAHRAAAEESPASPPPARRRLRRARAWPALAAAASLAVAVAVAINLRDLGDMANQGAEVTAAPATTAAAFAPATTAPAIEETAMEDSPPPAAEPESATAGGEAADADQMAEPEPLAPPPADSSETTASKSLAEEAPTSDAAFDDLPILWGTDEGTWESDRELADRAKALAAGQPDVFPMSYSEMAEYADRAGLACWDDFARQRDGGRETVAFAGRAWIGESWYEVYHLETEEPRWEGGPRYLLMAFTPPAGDEADGQCRPLFATEQESGG